MFENEAYRLVYNTLKALEHDDSRSKKLYLDTDIVALINKMESHPLALVQACAFIRATEKRSIVAYLNDYRTYKRATLNTKPPLMHFSSIDSTAEGTHPAVYAPECVWIAFDKIIIHIKEIRPKAAKLLQLIGFLAPTAINRKFLLFLCINKDEISSEDELQAQEALDVLIGFNFLRKEPTGYMLPYVFQDVIRTMHAETWVSAMTHLYINAARTYQLLVKTEDEHEGQDYKTLLSHFRYIESKFSEILKKITESDKAFTISYARFLSAYGSLLSYFSDYHNALGFLARALSMLLEYDEACTKPIIASTYETLGKAHFYTDNYAKARELFVKARELQLLLYGNRSIEYITSCRWYANTYNREDAPNEEKELALRLYKIALALLTSREQLNAIEQKEKASLLNSLAIAYERLDQYDLAVKAYKESLAFYPEKSLGMIKPLTNLGDCYCRQGQYEAAETALIKVLDIQKKYHPMGHIDIVITLSNLGKLYSETHDYLNMAKYMQEALKMAGLFWSVDDIPYLEQICQWGITLERLGDYTQAEMFLKNAQSTFLDSVKKRGESNIVFETFLVTSLGELYFYQEKYKEAQDSLETALIIKLAKKDIFKPIDLITEYTLLARLYAQDPKMHEKAIAFMKEVIELKTKHYKSEEHLQVVTSQIDLALVQRDMKNYSAALRLFETFFLKLTKIYKQKNLYMALSYYEYAVLLKEMGKYKDALSMTLLSIEQLAYFGHEPYYQKAKKLLDTLYEATQKSPTKNHLLNKNLVGPLLKIFAYTNSKDSPIDKDELETAFRPDTKNAGEVASAALTATTFKPQTNSDEETLIDLATLQSQRSINKAQVAGEEKKCRIIPAKPDGNCGFEATSLILRLSGNAALADAINRNSFIERVVSLHNGSDSELNILIAAMLERDRVATIDEWQEKFKGTTYWAHAEHFKVMSRIYNLQFEFYHLHTTVFRSYQHIYPMINTCADTTPTIIRLVYLPTKEQTGRDASLKHFDGLMIDPTLAQIEEIDKKMNETIISLGDKKRLYLLSKDFFPRG